MVTQNERSRGASPATTHHQAGRNQRARNKRGAAERQAHKPNGAAPGICMLESALQHVGRGWPVFPAHSGGEKRATSPRIQQQRSAMGCHHRSGGDQRDFGDMAEGEHWPPHRPGPESGCLKQIRSPAMGSMVSAIFGKLEKKHGSLPKTLMSVSPTGSVHHYFRCPKGVIIKSTTSKIAVGIDIRGANGMVFAPPSLRPGKGQYRWINNHCIADAPAWLIELCRDRNDDRQHGSNKTLMTDDLDELTAARRRDPKQPSRLQRMEDIRLGAPWRHRRRRLWLQLV